MREDQDKLKFLTNKLRWRVKFLGPNRSTLYRIVFADDYAEACSEARLISRTEKLTVVDVERKTIKFRKVLRHGTKDATKKE